MGEQSLVILAIQRAMNSQVSPPPGGSGYVDFHGSSSLDIFSEIPMDAADGIIDLMCSQVDDEFPSTSTFQREKESIKEFLETQSLLQLYEDGRQEKMTVNSFYSNKNGRMVTWLYDFSPEAKNANLVHIESLKVSSTFRLGDDIIILHGEKCSVLGNKNKFVEIRRIPPTVTADHFVQGLAFLLRPIVQASGVDTFTKFLKKTATAPPQGTVSDDARRTIYDPVKQMNVVVSDPAILQLIPTRWERATGSFQISQPVSNNWEFDA